MNEITPASLTIGYGEKVCKFLLSFIDCVLLTINFKPKPIEYLSNPMDDAVIDNDRENDNDEDVSTMKLVLRI